MSSRARPSGHWPAAGGSCRRTRPQTPRAPSEGRVPRHPPGDRPCPAGHLRPRRDPSASTAFAAAVPAPIRSASALRRSIARPWWGSALASQRCAAVSSTRGSTAEALTASFHANPKARAVLLGTAGARQPGSVWVVHPLARQSLYFTEQSVIAVLVLTRVPAFGL